MTGSNKAGRTVWFDVPAADLADAMSFYEGLLGWTYRKMEESPISDYVMIDAGGELIGGLRKMVDYGRRRGDGAVLYFTVEDLDAKIARSKELGAEIVGATVELGHQRGRYQWIRDRAGNLIGLWGMK